MLKGYDINQRRLEYLEKTIKLIDIANRIDERLENNDVKEILKQGVTSTSMLDKNEILDYSNKFNNGELKRNRILLRFVGYAVNLSS